MRTVSTAMRIVLGTLAILCLPSARPGFADDGAAMPSPARAASSPLDPDALKETRLFPLFAPSRRPPPPPVIEPPPAEAPPVAPVVAEAPPEPTPPSVELVGVVEMDGGAVALLKDPSSGSTKRVRAGQSIDDWQLRVVGPRMIALAHPDASQQHVLRVGRP